MEIECFDDPFPNNFSFKLLANQQRRNMGGMSVFFALQSLFYPVYPVTHRFYHFHGIADCPQTIRNPCGHGWRAMFTAKDTAAERRVWLFLPLFPYSVNNCFRPGRAYGPEG